MPRSYSMQTRQVTTTAVRGRILEAVLDELAAVGGEGITLQAVATRADVALRTLYNHFAGRDELLAAAFLHHAAQTRAAVEGLGLPDAGPDNQLRHVVEAYHLRYAQMGPRLSVLLSLRGYPELREQVRVIRDWRRQLLAQIVDRAQRSDLLKVPPATAVALSFTLTSHAGWQTLYEELDGDPAEVTRIANEALSSALFHR